jgi:predicted phosphodiesterase
MIIAILSDIHGNLPALNVVLQDAREQQAGEYWCLGDVVGYGPEPCAAWQRLSQLDIPHWGWVAGNHDWYLTGQLTDDVEIETDGQKVRRDASGLKPEIQGQRFTMGFLYPEAREVIARHKTSLQTEAALWKSLENLPVVASPRQGIYLTHGCFMRGNLLYNVEVYSHSIAEAEWSLDSLKERPFPWDDAGPLQAASDQGWGAPRLLITGHTHVPVLWRRQDVAGQPGRSWEALTLPLDEWFPLDDLRARPVFMNPGSVGQPRYYSGLARYALLEWESSRVPRVLFRELEYDYQETQEEMRTARYPERLIDRLGKRQD